jgi:hypothetical protein
LLSCSVYTMFLLGRFAKFTRGYSPVSLRNPAVEEVNST